MTIREKLNQVVFGTDTRAGKNFDIILLWSILLSVTVVVLESVPYYNFVFSREFYYIEWTFTVFFTLEYLLRLYISPKPIRYIFSFWGIIDLLSVIPTYISLFIAGTHYLLVVRIFRLLRVFRILKLVRFNDEANMLLRALKGSLYKISIFLFAIIAIVILLGTVMYVIEGGENGFTSIPHSIYWAVITITTVGYGDIVPHSVLGKTVASFAMIIGYSIIAVPTGIVTFEISKASKNDLKCSSCSNKLKKEDNYCSQCGETTKH